MTQHQNDSINPRESMKQALPDWIQPFLTWLTAKPYDGEKPTYIKPLNHFLDAALSLPVGVTIAAYGFYAQSFGLMFILLGWFILLHGAQKLRITIYHGAAHTKLFGSPRLDQFIGDAIAIVTLSKPLTDYKTEHILNHHPPDRLLLPGDDTYHFLIGTLGLKPGDSLPTLWQKVIIKLLSPRLHLRLTLDRIATCLLSGHERFNLGAIAVWSLILYGVHHYHLWMMFAVAYLFPITILFNIVRALRLLVEHRWPDPEYNNARHKVALAQMTAAIHLGEPIPRFEAHHSNLYRLYRWTRWGAMMIYHFGVRSVVLPGDTPVHDYHHRRPVGDWANAIYERTADIEAGYPGWPSPYIESWGLINAIQQVLRSLSLQSPRILKDR